MHTLVTLATAKNHLRLSESTHEDDDLEMKIIQAQALVLDYVNQRHGDAGTTWAASVAAWDDETVPAQVQAAILLQLGDLYRTRGDEGEDVKRDAGMLAPGVVALLYRLRDPALA